MIEHEGPLIFAETDQPLRYSIACEEESSTDGKSDGYADQCIHAATSWLDT